MVANFTDPKASLFFAKPIVLPLQPEETGAFPQ